MAALGAQSPSSRPVSFCIRAKNKKDTASNTQSEGQLGRLEPSGRQMAPGVAKKTRQNPFPEQYTFCICAMKEKDTASKVFFEASPRGEITRQPQGMLLAPNKFQRFAFRQPRGLPPNA